MKIKTLSALALASALSTSALFAADVATITQTAVYQGATSQDLFDLFVNAKQHSDATHPASGEVVFVDPESGEKSQTAQVGDVMQGFYLPDGTPGLVAEIVELDPGERLVMNWINFAWQTAVDPEMISDKPSLLVLEFADNTIGAEIQMTHIGVPAYEVAMPVSPFAEDGEFGPLSEIVRVHWELVYWQPMREYLALASAE